MCRRGHVCHVGRGASKAAVLGGATVLIAATLAAGRSVTDHFFLRSLFPPGLPLGSLHGRQEFGTLTADKACS